MRNNFNLFSGDGFAMPFFQHFGSTPKLLKLIGCQIFQKCFILFFFVAAFTNFIYGQVDGCDIDVLGGGTAFCDPVNVTIDCAMVDTNDGCIEINNITNDCGGSGYTCVDIVFDIQDLIACDVLTPGLADCINEQPFPLNQNISLSLEFSVLAGCEVTGIGGVRLYDDNCIDVTGIGEEYVSPIGPMAIKSGNTNWEIVICSSTTSNIVLAELNLTASLCEVEEITCPNDTIVDCIDGFVPSLLSVSDDFCGGVTNGRSDGTKGDKIDNSFKMNDVLLESTEPILLNGIPNCPGAIYEVIYSLPDTCLNTTTCSQMVMIDDNDPPTITPPAMFGGDIICEEDIVIGIPSYTTSCGVEGSLTVDMPIVVGLPNCSNTTYTFVHRVTDDCGRIAELEEVFEIVNDAPIILSCPNDTTIGNINDLVIGVPVFNISCGDGTVEMIGPTLIVEPDCCTTQIYNMIYKITDECERVADCSQMITVLKPRTEINFE